MGEIKKKKAKRKRIKAKKMDKLIKKEKGKMENKKKWQVKRKEKMLGTQIGIHFYSYPPAILHWYFQLGLKYKRLTTLDFMFVDQQLLLVTSLVMLKVSFKSIQ